MDDQTKKEILDMIYEIKKKIDLTSIIKAVTEIRTNLDRIALKIDEDFYNKNYQNSPEEIKKRLSNNEKNEKIIRYLHEGGKIPLEKKD